MKPPFRAYDVRGLYPEEINEELAYNIGRGAVQFLEAKDVVIGRDCRTSSLSLKKSLVQGVTDQGCNVVDTGYCNTPMLYYVAQKYHCMMITASHNPKQYNGVKITRKGVEPLGEHNGLPEVENFARAYVKFDSNLEILMDIYEAPNEETAAKVSMISLANGALQAQSMVAIPYKRFLELTQEI